MDQTFAAVAESPGFIRANLATYVLQYTPLKKLEAAIDRFFINFGNCCYAGAAGSAGRLLFAFVVSN